MISLILLLVVALAAFASCSTVAVASNMNSAFLSASGPLVSVAFPSAMLVLDGDQLVAEFPLYVTAGVAPQQLNGRFDAVWAGVSLGLGLQFTISGSQKCTMRVVVTRASGSTAIVYGVLECAGATQVSSNTVYSPNYGAPTALAIQFTRSYGQGGVTQPFLVAQAFQQ